LKEFTVILTRGLRSIH